MRELTSRFHVNQSGNGAPGSRSNGGSVKPTDDELRSALSSVEKMTEV